MLRGNRARTAVKSYGEPWNAHLVDRDRMSQRLPGCGRHHGGHQGAFDQGRRRAAAQLIDVGARNDRRRLTDAAAETAFREQGGELAFRGRQNP